MQQNRLMAVSKLDFDNYSLFNGAYFAIIHIRSNYLSLMFSTRGEM